MQTGDTLFIIFVVIFSAVIHEVMHGVAADWLGDKTARYAGRLTLNPLVHLDLVGSIMLPLFLLLSGSPLFFAWAKPVPYNPYNLRPGRFSEAIVAFAGPLSNLVIALIVGFIIRIHILDALNGVLFLIVVTNMMLCIFNLIPIPPLDGSKILTSILPTGLGLAYGRFRSALEQFPFVGMLIVVLVVYGLGNTFSSFIYYLANLITGM